MAPRNTVQQSCAAERAAILLESPTGDEREGGGGMVDCVISRSIVRDDIGRRGGREI